MHSLERAKSHEAMIHAVINNALILDSKVPAGNSWILDCRRLLMSGYILEYFCEALWKPMSSQSFDFLVGQGVGSMPLLIGLKYRSLQARSKPLNTLFVRDAPKSTNLRTQIEGGPPFKGMKIWIVDDILHTGASIARLLENLKEYEPQVLGISVAVNYLRNGNSEFLNRKIPVHHALTREEIGITRKRPVARNSLSLSWHHPELNINPLWMHSVPQFDWDHNRIVVSADTLDTYSFDIDSGTLRWKIGPVSEYADTPKGRLSTPVIHGSNVVVTDYTGHVIHLDRASGWIEKAYKVARWIHGRPLFIEDALVLGVEDQKDTTPCGSLVKYVGGSCVGRVDVFDYVPCSPSYDPVTRTLVFVSNENKAYFVNFDLMEIRSVVDLKGKNPGTPLIHNGVCYIADNGGQVTAMNMQGSILWSDTCGYSLTHGVPKIIGGRLIIASDNGFLIAYNPITGDRIWIRQYHRAPVQGVVAVEDQYMACVTRAGEISILSHDGEKLDYYETRKPCRQPPNYSRGKLALATDTNGLLMFDLDLSKLG